MNTETQTTMTREEARQMVRTMKSNGSSASEIVRALQETDFVTSKGNKAAHSLVYFWLSQMRFPREKRQARQVRVPNPLGVNGRPNARQKFLDEVVKDSQMSYDKKVKIVSAFLQAE